MENKEKIILLFPDGVGIRNYLYSKVFKDINYDLILWHNFDSAAVKTIKETTPIEYEYSIPQYKESLKEKFLRELICLCRLYYNSAKLKNPTLLTNWNWNQKTIFRKIFYKTIQFLAFFIKKYKTILKLEAAYQKTIRKNPFYFEVKDILRQIKPKMVFCAHQRALKAATIFAAASDLGIETTTVIFSWDNLPKARLALRADNYLLWSQNMKNEMNLYYPEVDSGKLHVTSTPQFEFYDNTANVIERNLFFQKYNLNPDKKIICFSGDDIKTSPDDPYYLKDIAQELIKNNLHLQYQILLRRCPVDFSGRYDAIVKEYAELIKEVPPLWNNNISNEWNAVYPSPEDVKLLVSTVFYADLVVNVGSTMAFDFAIYNKPCIFINYDQENKTEKDWSVKTIYQFQHFKSMPDDDAVIWWNVKEELAELLINQNWNNHTMMRWKEIVLDDYSNASLKISNKL